MPKEAKITTCVLGPDARLYPYGPNYKGPPGPIVCASKTIEEDNEGEYQVIRYFYGIAIRVPPLETWPEGAVIERPDPRERSALYAGTPIEYIRATPSVPKVVVTTA
jgi:hypothetical protein